LLTQFKAKAFIYLEKMMNIVDPGWWIGISAVLFIISLIHIFPLEIPEDNHDFSDRLLVWTRKAILFFLLFVGLLFPGVFYLLFGVFSSAPDVVTSDLILQWYYEMFKNYWTVPVASVMAGVLINFSWHRYGEPYISNMQRKYRVTQAEEDYSDARDEVVKNQPKKFDPEKYFRIEDNLYFIGLDENDNPIYVKREVFEKTHKALVGPTRFGKGVEAGVLLTQSVRFGNSVFMVDPKDDDNLPYILQNEAKKAEKPFVYLDLNPDGKGHWHPFKGGTVRERRSRILAAFGLEMGGTNADVYKSKERGIVDDLLEKTDGSIMAMVEAIIAIAGKDDLSELRDNLVEWSKISTFTPNRKKKGHSIDTSLLNGAIVYVRGSIDDSVVRRATRVYISELMQAAKRLKKDRPCHLTIFVDELRFVMSSELVDALATSAGFDVDINLATQAISDCKNLDDSTLDGEALQQSLEVNCQLKWIYKAGDETTADWGEGISGSKWIRVPRTEATKVNRWGGEVWDKVRQFNRVEAPIISRNQLLTLKPTVCAFWEPDSLARIIYTHWVSVDKSYASWEKPDASGASQSDSTEAQPGVAAATEIGPVQSDKRADVVAENDERAGEAPQAKPVPRMRGNPKFAKVSEPSDEKEAN
jgi:hypothetical protein